MKIATYVNADKPLDLVCMSVLAKFTTQYLFLDRCCGFVFEQFDCFEFVSSINSLTVLQAMDSESAARATFEKLHRRKAELITLTTKPLPFESVRTVEIRDHCDGGGDV